MVTIGHWKGGPRVALLGQPGLHEADWIGDANTDLDLQLKKHGIIVTGLIAHTCVETTVRYAAFRSLMSKFR